MTKTVSAYEARTNLGELMDLVHYKDAEVVVERRGKPMVRLVNAGKETAGKKPKDLLSKYIGIWADIESKMLKDMHAFRRDFELLPA